MSKLHPHKMGHHSPPRDRTARVTAVLGPTNTGKTHFAIERMLAHRSGMIGLPLRLLAREVYDKIVRLKGAADVALITGEERIVPAHPRFYICTVEAMPVDIRVAFLAIDEIQLAADYERGHIFTDRLLNARGEEETMFLGSATMRGAIQRFVPGAHFISRPRFSDLAYTGAKKLTRLPRRSAIVAFSAEDVYGLADIVRTQRGGAAVVMGALSPRTRNAQVALYQSGDVDFLIATDAIGMGVNMDVDHVGFAATEKFDGLAVRPLRADEMGQIAGRAGRYMNDGTFGVTGDAEPLTPEMVSQIENHRYDPVRVLQWRNADLDFSSLDHLLASLDVPPPLRGLAKARPASDHWTLKTLAGDDGLRAMATAPAAIRRLWEACQLPDFRKLTADEHAKLVMQIYGYLMSAEGVIPADWLARQIERLDITEGDVDTLSGRLAQIRTWTYASHKQHWTGDPAHWQDLTRAIEDKLSDALHERLTQRFIDRRTSVLMRQLRDEDMAPPVLDDSGAVSLGGEHIGKLEGFRFQPDPRAEDGIHGKTLRAAALKGLEGEILARARRLIAAEDRAITLSEHGQLWWEGSVVARLAAGAHTLSPVTELLADELLKNPQREAVELRLGKWMTDHIARVMAPLAALRTAVDSKQAVLPNHARGLAYQLTQGFGYLARDEATLPDDLRAAGQALRSFGVKIGRRAIYLPHLLKPEAAALGVILWSVYGRISPIPPAPTPGLTSFVLDENDDRASLAAAGFRVCGPRAVRIDIVDRIEDMLDAAMKTKAQTTAKTDSPLRVLLSLLGSPEAEGLAVAASLGWKYTEVKAAEGEAPALCQWQRIYDHSQRKNKNKKQPAKSVKAEPEKKIDPHSPFAGLKVLIRG